jgi:hypothetical protein
LVGAFSAAARGGALAAAPGIAHAQQGISNQEVTRLYAKDMVREEQAITVRERDPPRDLTARFADTAMPLLRVPQNAGMCAGIRIGPMIKINGISDAYYRGGGSGIRTTNLARRTRLKSRAHSGC